MRYRTIQISKQTHLLNLPTELRLMIFELVLGGKTIRVVSGHNDGDKAWILGTRGNYLSLLAVCRQIHIETALIPFKASIFVFSTQKVLHNWVATLLPSQRASIGIVQLGVSRSLKNFGKPKDRAQDLALKHLLPGLKVIVLHNLLGTRNRFHDLSENPVGRKKGPDLKEPLETANTGVIVLVEGTPLKWREHYCHLLSDKRDCPLADKPE